MSGVTELPDKKNLNEVELGGGAQFWAYISPQNDTAKYVTKWAVKLQQGNWSASITSDNPTKTLKTPNLSGLFTVTVTASGPNFKEKQLKPCADSKPNIGCNSNCSSMIQIVANETHNDACYITTWDAICN